MRVSDSFRSSLLSLSAIVFCSMTVIACDGDKAELAHTDSAATAGSAPGVIGVASTMGSKGGPALIPQATEELGADTIPLKTPEGGPARYGLASGRIVQRFIGGLKGERTIVFDQWGLRERKDEIYAPDPPGRPGPIINSIVIATRDSFGMVEVRTKSGWIMKNTMDDRYMASDSSKKMSMARFIQATSPGKPIPDTVINGYHCKGFVNLAPGIRHITWVWRGIPIREHFIAVADSMEFWVETVELQPNVSVPEASFRFPAEYKVTPTPEPKPGEQWVPPNMRDQVAAPPGVPPGGGAPPGGAPPGGAPPGGIPPGGGAPGAGAMGGQPPAGMPPGGMQPPKR